LVIILGVFEIVSAFGIRNASKKLGPPAQTTAPAAAE
jgi:hypothetical protein